MTIALAAVRTLVGLVFVVAGSAKFLDHATYAANFARWTVPAPDVAVWLVGAVEIVCGALFALGALTRPVGLILATVMVGAAVFAGRAEGGFHVIAPPLLFLACVFFAWRSGRVGGRTPVRPPGVQ